jgi:hypothetical protein
MTECMTRQHSTMSCATRCVIVLHKNAIPHVVHAFQDITPAYVLKLLVTKTYFNIKVKLFAGA